MRGPEDMCDQNRVRSNSAHSSTMDNQRALNKSVDFSDYMWMVEEGVDDFDKKCEEEFWEEYWLQEAFEEMIEEEERSSTQYYVVPQEVEDDEHTIYEYYPVNAGIEEDINNLNFNNSNSSRAMSTSSSAAIDIASNTRSSTSAPMLLSTTPLNPDAAEFVPRSWEASDALAADDNEPHADADWPECPRDHTADR